MGERTVSKGRFKAQALEHLRKVQETGKELVITDRGTPVVKVVPYESDAEARLQELRGTVRRYIDPTKPVSDRDWKAAR